MSTCSRCGGFKPDYGQCSACAKIDSDRRIAEEQREANEDIARRNLKVQAGIAAFMAADAQKKHNELMEHEEIRLQELKKQTQILLEQNLTVEEVYQMGFNFEDANDAAEFDEDLPVYLSLDDRGNIVASYDNPYVQVKFRKAYAKGIEDKLKQDYSKGPGVEFMSEAAFNRGYMRSEYCSILFPSSGQPRFMLTTEIKPNYSESVNQDDGSLQCEWTAPYNSEILNQSFEAGINKYLKEQNTLAKKKDRLANIHQDQAKQRAIKAANDEEAATRAKVQAEKESQEKLVKSIKGALIGGLCGGLAAIPLFFFIWFFSIFFGGTSWTLVGFTESLAAIGVVLGFFSGM